MTLLAGDPGTEPSRPVPSELARAPRRGWRLSPSWPLTLLLVGFPVLWALGLSAFAVHLVAIPMAIQLVRRRPIKVPAGFGIWLLFLVCSFAGVLVLGVNPPGTLPNSFIGRLVGYGVRESSYVAITVVLLYVGNLTYKELPERRLIKQLSFFFVTVTIGGVLGLLFPNVSFTSAVESSTSVIDLFVPGSISQVPYVSRLIHPAFAQVQDFGGDLLPRPSAPFAYTNTWASMLSMLGIWFGVGWLVVFTRTQRVLGILVVLVAGVTLVYSLNRGAWVGVVLGVLFVVVVLATRGRLLPLAGVLVTLAVASQIFLYSPLKQVIETRADNGVSNSVRAFTTVKAFELSAQSPVIGFGTTRSSIGSPASIAIGRSPECPLCGNVAIGINGSFYTLLVSTGYTGVLLFFGFWLNQAWRSRRDTSVVGLASQLTLLTAFFYGFVYTIELTVPFLVLALMWRRRMNPGEGQREQIPHGPARVRGRLPAHGMRFTSERTTR